MSYTLDESGQALTETCEGVTMPVDYSFAAVSDFVHSHDTQFECLQALCLGMAEEIERQGAALRVGLTQGERKE